MFHLLLFLLYTSSDFTFFEMVQKTFAGCSRDLGAKFSVSSCCSCSGTHLHRSEISLAYLILAYLYMQRDQFLQFYLLNLMFYKFMFIDLFINQISRNLDGKKENAFKPYKRKLGLTVG